MHFQGKTPAPVTPEVPCFTALACQAASRGSKWESLVTVHQDAVKSMGTLYPQQSIPTSQNSWIGSLKI